MLKQDASTRTGCGSMLRASPLAPGSLWLGRHTCGQRWGWGCWSIKCANELGEGGTQDNVRGENMDWGQFQAAWMRYNDMDTVEPAVLVRRAEHGACERHYGAKPFAGPNRAVREGGAPQRNRPGGACWCGRPLRGPFHAGCRLGADGHPGRTGKCAENILNSEYADYFPAPWILNFTLIYCINNLVTSVGITSLHFPFWQSCPSIYKLGTMRDFPGFPVVRAWCFHCHGPSFDPRSGN